MLPCRNLPLPTTTFPEEGEVTATEGLGPRDKLGHGRRVGVPLGQECSLQVSTVPPTLILVSQGMRVLYFVEALCLRAGTMAQINYDGRQRVRGGGCEV